MSTLTRQARHIMVGYNSNYPDGITDWSFIEGAPDRIDCGNCGNSYPTEIADAMGYEDHCDTKCHHCKDSDGEITEEEYAEFCGMEVVNDSV